MSKLKTTLLGKAVPVIPKEPEKAKPEANTVLTGTGDTMQPGDIVKIKQKDKTKSPYSVVRGLDHEAKQVDIEPLDAPGNGNRTARRKRFKEGK